MTNHREILRLTSLGINNSRIAESMGITRQTVITTLQRAAAQGVDWSTAETLSDRELAARLFPQGDQEMAEYHSDRKLDKAFITRLGSCQFAEDRHNVLILGATGSGKTYLANALGVAAGRNFYTVRYMRLPDLLGELAIARAEGTYRKILRPTALRDSYVLEFLDLPQKHKEKDLRKAIVGNLKEFILEFGKDFTFAGEEYRVQVGNRDFFIDLLFYR